MSRLMTKMYLPKEELVLPTIKGKRKNLTRKRLSASIYEKFEHYVI